MCRLVSVIISAKKSARSCLDSAAMAMPLSRVAQNLPVPGCSDSAVGRTTTTLHLSVADRRSRSALSASSIFLAPATSVRIKRTVGDVPQSPRDDTAITLGGLLARMFAAVRFCARGEAGETL